jgi:hypothetical protein
VTDSGPAILITRRYVQGLERQIRDANQLQTNASSALVSNPLPEVPPRLAKSFPRSGTPRPSDSHLSRRHSSTHTRSHTHSQSRSRSPNRRSPCSPSASNDPTTATSLSLIQWLSRRECTETPYFGERPVSHQTTGETSLHAPPSAYQLLTRLPIGHDILIPSHSENLEGAPEAYCDDGQKERSRLPERAKMIELVDQYLAYSNNNFALLHEPTLWKQVESVLESQRVKKLDVFIVTSEQSSAGGRCWSTKTERAAQWWWL